MTFIRLRLIISATIFFLSIGFQAVSVSNIRAQAATEATNAEPNLTEEEMRQFLLSAEIIKGRQTSTGVTRPYRLTLSDGKLTHDAGFQSIDIFKSSERFDDGTTEINFRDSYHFNIAAYELAKLVGLHHMMPVTVERKWKGKKGSLTWWIDAQMSERERHEKKIGVPDIGAWNKQMHCLRVFSQLVYDKDRNLTNVLIGQNWEIYMIDFSRAFRLHKNLLHPEDLVACSRPLLEKMRQLNQTELERKLKPHLGKNEIKALLARRDEIVARFDELIAQKGENEVLY
jgi:hypothetical protein